MAKLFNYDFEITYKQGKDNAAADALSRLPTAELMTFTMSTPTGSLMPEVERS